MKDWSHAVMSNSSSLRQHFVERIDEAAVQTDVTVCGTLVLEKLRGPLEYWEVVRRWTPVVQWTMFCTLKSVCFACLTTHSTALIATFFIRMQCTQIRALCTANQRVYFQLLLTTCVTAKDSHCTAYKREKTCKNRHRERKWDNIELDKKWNRLITNGKWTRKLSFAFKIPRSDIISFVVIGAILNLPDVFYRCNSTGLTSFCCILQSSIDTSDVDSRAVWFLLPCSWAWNSLPPRLSVNNTPCRLPLLRNSRRLSISVARMAVYTAHLWQLCWLIFANVCLLFLLLLLLLIIITIIVIVIAQAIVKVTPSLLTAGCCRLATWLIGARRTQLHNGRRGIGPLSWRVLI